MRLSFSVETSNEDMHKSFRYPESMRSLAVHINVYLRREKKKKEKD